MELNSKFTLKQTVYFIHENRVCKSTITGIKFPTIWVYKNEVNQTAFYYIVKSLGNNHSRYGNSGGFPECLLFSCKKELLKSL